MSLYPVCVANCQFTRSERPFGPHAPAKRLQMPSALHMRIQHFPGFVYQQAWLRRPWSKLRIKVRIEPHRGLRTPQY